MLDCRTCSRWRGLLRSAFRHIDCAWLRAAMAHCQKAQATECNRIRTYPVRVVSAWLYLGPRRPNRLEGEFPQACRATVPQQHVDRCTAKIFWTATLPWPGLARLSCSDIFHGRHQLVRASWRAATAAKLPLGAKAIPANQFFALEERPTGRCAGVPQRACDHDTGGMPGTSLRSQSRHLELGWSGRPPAPGQKEPLGADSRRTFLRPRRQGN